MGSNTLRRVTKLILPVLLAGLGHVAVLRTGVLQSLAVPLDGGRQWRRRPVFGVNKSWRGVLIMVGLTALTTRLQAARSGARCTESRAGPWLTGALVGLSYALAELPNSFVKRQLDIAPGASTGRVQYLIDQSDSVMGCLLTMALLGRVRRADVVPALVLGTGAHVVVDRFMHGIGLKGRTRPPN